MPFSLTWLPQALLDAGLKVATVKGWEFRGFGDMGEVFGIICHHTGGPRKLNMPSLNTIIEGRSDLRGPLAQLALGRDGTWYIIGAGRCNHAGMGVWNGITAGNSHFLGVEAENTGLPDGDPWPGVQMDAYRRGVAALLAHIGRDAEWCAGHKEYALPHGRKNDPSFDMAEFRLEVSELLNGAALPLPPIPAAEPTVADREGRPTLRRPATGDLVKFVQTTLDLSPNGSFGPETEAAVRAFQRDHALVPDGIVGPKTWAAFDQICRT
jgi:peptidoglycan hydrolase-like protein with peptidoglycan-binding domain